MRLNVSQKTTTKKRPRTRRQVGRWKSYARLGALVSSVVAVGVIWWLEYPQLLVAKTAESCVNLTQNAGFRLNDLMVTGRHHAPVDRILQAVDLQQGEPIFKRSPVEIRDSLQEIPWILSATVMRQLPSKVFINIVERQPVAVWQHQKVHYLVDANGVIISNDKLGEFAKLPVIVGADAPMHAPKMLHIINEFPEIKSRMTALIRVGARRWDLQLDQKIIVKLPEEKPEEALSRLVLLIRQKKLTASDMSIVDLRLPKQIILRLSPVGEVKITGKGDET